MAPPKRKRAHEEPDEKPATRRATRQTSAAPLPVALPDPEPRKPRGRHAHAHAHALAHAHAHAAANGDTNRDDDAKPDKASAVPAPAKGAAEAKRKPGRPKAEPAADETRATRKTRHSGASVDEGEVPPPTRRSRTTRSLSVQPPVEPPKEVQSVAEEASRPAVPPPRGPGRPRTVAPANRTQQAPRPQLQPKKAQATPPQPLPYLQPPQQNLELQRAAVPVPDRKLDRAARTTSKNTTSKAGAGRKPSSAGERADRNIDKVVLGNVCFRAWYPSYYGKEMLGEASGNSSAKGGTGTGTGTGGTATGAGKAAGEENNGGKSSARARDAARHMTDRLYVCPCCFKYSTQLVPWRAHVAICEQRASMPGRKIYTHPRGRRTIYAGTAGAAAVGGSPVKGRGRKRADAAPEEVVQDEGEWSIWEVDGEKEVLFCQNLSLFAKLFLDNKSVFFDVTGFNYFLLAYTPPPPKAAAAQPPPNEPTPALTPAPTPTPSPSPGPRPQIVGFFSKEKMSWDNNNLACILVFPPWQRKGLGALLMGVSYEMSRRERVLGGPEKPISDLGRKGYKRFWAGEVARWLLTTADTAGDGDGETVVDVDACSRATWILPEDCLVVLRDMGLMQDAGLGLPTGHRAKDDGGRGGTSDGGGGGGDAGGAQEDGEADKDAADKEKNEAPVQEVPRVKISREAVRWWVQAHGISLQRACDPDGFIEGYAMPETPAVEIVD